MCGTWVAVYSTIPSLVGSGLRDHGPWLDGVGDETLLDVALLDHHVGLLERAIHIANF